MNEQVKTEKKKLRRDNLVVSLIGILHIMVLGAGRDLYLWRTEGDENALFAATVFAAVSILCLALYDARWFFVKRGSGTLLLAEAVTIAVALVLPHFLHVPDTFWGQLLYLVIADIPVSIVLDPVLQKHYHLTGDGKRLPPETPGCEDAA